MDQNETKRPEEEKVTALDDERRVKVLSPGALVAKRFFRNRLAVIGLIILVAMFMFSFVGGLVSPYGESQVFEGYEMMHKDFAGVTRNSDFRYVEIEEGALPSSARNQFLLAANKGEATFTYDNVTYAFSKEGEDSYTIGNAVPAFDVAQLRGETSYSARDGFTVTDELKAAYEAAQQAGESSFAFDGGTYVIQGANKLTTVSRLEPAALAAKTIMEAATDAPLTYDFCVNALRAKRDGKTSFEVEGKKFSMEIDDEAAIVSLNGEEYATLSPYVVQAVEKGVTITAEMKTAIIEAIENDEESITILNDAGEEEILTIERKDTQYTVRRDTMTKIIRTYEAPSKEHWLGTDVNGMDILTRLMYGGRISLMIGFVVILIEVVIGVVLGGFAGYFGGWVDNLIMRLVDIFNCIPTWPILIIIGSIMDAQQIDATMRIYMMMLVLGLLGWPGVARMVRGQILSLREQEFMIAAEATGLSVRRRIFRHLIPNVIPQLIVMCTMGLGGIILTESTMSFLGLGVKFPYASWGNIIQSVSNVYVMTNYWFIWIPAGFLILITVLGFNFVGDGLRDAFDPKMKR